MPTLNKKGQSLVEVVVALGILTFVFAGTITLIVQIVSLQLATRSRTEAVALAQKVMAETVSTLSDGCGNVTAVTKIDQPDPSGGNKFTYDVTAVGSESYQSSDTSEAIGGTKSDVGLDGSNGFNEVTVAVTWDDRDYAGNSYTLKQIVGP